MYIYAKIKSSDKRINLKVKKYSRIVKEMNLQYFRLLLVRYIVFIAFKDNYVWTKNSTHENNGYVKHKNMMHIHIYVYMYVHMHAIIITHSKI